MRLISENVFIIISLIFSRSPTCYEESLCLQGNLTAFEKILSVRKVGSVGYRLGYYSRTYPLTGTSEPATIYNIKGNHIYLFPSLGTGLCINDLVCISVLNLDCRTMTKVSGKGKKARSFSGCKCCKQAKRKCPEERPKCSICEKLGLECEVMSPLFYY